MIAYIALGANIGDRVANIEQALVKLGAADGIRIVRTSSFLENPAVVGPPDSPPFLNAVAEVETTLPPTELLAHLLQIESGMGRRRREKWGPRIIDLDLILFGNQIIDAPNLTVPHPFMHQRRFVLQPLAELAPDLLHPKLARSIQSLLDELHPAA